MKRLHAIRFQLYDFWERKNIRDSKKIRACQGLEKNEGGINR